MATKLPPMADGGQWIQKPDGSPPIYVTHKEHIKRLVLDGAQVVADPRPALAAQQHEQEVSEAEDLKAQIARLQAQLESKQTQGSASAQDAPDEHASRKHGRS